jgi:hypothetical protein
MRGLVFNRSQQGIGFPVNTVDAELVRPRQPGIRTRSFNVIQGISMVVKPHTIAKPEFLTGCGYLAQLRDYITHMILNSKPLIAFEILFTADRTKCKTPTKSF